VKHNPSKPPPIDRNYLNSIKKNNSDKKTNRTNQILNRFNEYSNPTIAVFTVVLGIYAMLQYCSSEKTIIQFRKLSDSTAIANKFNLDSTTNANYKRTHNDDSVSQLRFDASIEFTKRQDSIRFAISKIELRPDISIDSVIGPHIEIGSPITVRILFHNNGSTPAFNIRRTSGVDLGVDIIKTGFDSTDMVQRKIKRNGNKFSPHTTNGVMVIGAENITKDDFDFFTKGYERVFILLRYRYDDKFGDTFIFNYCAYYDRAHEMWVQTNCDESN
jgi:hypothetical protein